MHRTGVSSRLAPLLALACALGGCLAPAAGPDASAAVDLAGQCPGAGCAAADPPAAGPVAPEPRAAPDAVAALPASLFGASGAAAFPVGPEVEALFAAIDADGALDLDEARAFYAAVDARVAYRYDDERVKDPLRGLAVGDGRDGKDFAQSPDETLAEGFGDCEDTAILEAAFYRRAGVPAVLGYVNLSGHDRYDHALLLVPLSGNGTEAAAALGKARVYDVGPGFGVEPGAYLLVDHANSDGYGIVTTRMRPGAYALFEVHDPLGMGLLGSGEGERPVPRLVEG